MERYSFEKAQEEAAQMREVVESGEAKSYGDAKGVVEKETAWGEKRKEIDEIGDLEGRGIDEGIKEAVVAFNMHELPTHNSCEGHIDHGLPYPFVEVAADGEPVWRYEEQKKLFGQIAQEKSIADEKLDRKSPEWDVNLYEEVNNETWKRVVEIPENELEDTFEHRKWKEENKKIFEKMQALMCEYRQQEREGEIDPDFEIVLDGNEETRFTIRPKSGFERAADGLRYMEKRAQNNWKLGTKEELDLRIKLEKRRAEMERFAKFLRDRYFETKNLKQEPPDSNFLQEQARLLESQWDGKFRQLITEKIQENQQEKTKKENESPEILHERTFKRYMEGLGLNEYQLKDKKILDLGCGEGEFIGSLAEKEITSEAYGIDAALGKYTIEDQIKHRLFQGNFEEDLLIKEVDYVISVGAVSNAIWGGEEVMNIRSIIEKSLASLKEDGEIRIYPLQEAAKATPLSGIEESQQKWNELLEEISETQDVEYSIKPRDVKVVGNNNDIILESVLIIRRKKDHQSL